MFGSRTFMGLCGTAAGAALGMLGLIADTPLRTLLLVTTLAVVGTAVGLTFYSLGQASIIDHTTGLHNRRYFVRQLDLELARAARHGRPVSLVIVDIDEFKQYNDRFGHLTGDLVLRALARVARSQVRAFDTVARWGGEEFALILPEADKAGAFQVADRVRASVAAQVLAGVPDPVTISAGVATFPLDGSTAEELVSAADRALYQAKERGDRVVSFDS